MGQITREFDEPFSELTNSLPSSFSPSVVGIAGRPYLLDTKSGNYSRRAVDVVQQRNTSDSRDLLLLPQDVWRQMQQSWHQGAGQGNLDRDTALPYRFENSFGIDPWNQWQCSLLPATKRFAGTSSLTGTTWLTTYNSYLAVVNNQSIYWYDSFTASAAYATTVVNSGDPIIDIANFGSVVTTLHASYRVYETAGPGVASTYDNQRTVTNADFIAWEKDYLILGAHNKLYDATSKATSAGLIFTHPVASFRWKSAAAGNSCIYVLGGAADKYVIHRVNIKDDGTGLNPCIVAATLPDGEIGYSIDSYLGFVFIGTNLGVRMAVASANGDLTLGPIIPTTTPVRCFEGQDRFVWFGNSAISSAYSSLDNSDSGLFPATTVCGLGRMDLSTFTVTSITPAWANDIVSLGETGKTVQSVVTFLGKRVYSVNNGGVYYESDELMAGGWLTQGTMSFSVEDLKTGLYMQGKWLPLKGSIAFDIAYDSTGYVRVVSVSQEDSIRSSNISLNGVQFSRVNARYVLLRSDSNVNEGPTLTRWEIRAIPVKGRASRWTLPVMNYDQIEIDGVEYNRDVRAELDTLMNLAENGGVFSLQESGRSYQVHVKDFLWQPEKLSSNGQGWQGLYTMIVEEVQ